MTDVVLITSIRETIDKIESVNYWLGQQSEKWNLWRCLSHSSSGSNVCLHVGKLEGLRGLTRQDFVELVQRLSWVEPDRVVLYIVENNLQIADVYRPYPSD